jgi:hypothetical protein
VLQCLSSGKKKRLAALIEGSETPLSIVHAPPLARSLFNESWKQKVCQVAESHWAMDIRAFAIRLLAELVDLSCTNAGMPHEYETRNAFGRAARVGKDRKFVGRQSVADALERLSDWFTARGSRL